MINLVDCLPACLPASSIHHTQAICQLVVRPVPLLQLVYCGHNAASNDARYATVLIAAAASAAICRMVLVAMLLCYPRHLQE